MSDENETGDTLDFAHGPDDPYAFDPPVEGISIEEASELARQAELDERDAGLGEFDGPVARGETKEEQRAALAESMAGLSLAWWREEDGEAILSIANSLGGQAENYLNDTDQLIKYGVSATAMSTTVPVNWRSGPILMAALQMFGLFCPDMRDDVVEVLRIISTSIPPATPEEVASMEVAATAIATARQEQLASAMEGLFPGIGLFPGGPEPAASDQGDPGDETDHEADLGARSFDAGMN